MEMVSDMGDVLAIITARGGSKRIPGKNIKNFCGQPIINYSINAAVKSGIFKEVMVSTDSQEIANVAKEAGAVVPFMRSEKTSDDYATTADVLSEVIEKYQELGKRFDYFACLYPTAPFVTEDVLTKAYEKLLEKRGDVLIPVVSFSYPPQRGFIIDNNGMMGYKWPENFRKRSQDLEKMYHDCGQFYFYRTAAFLEKRGQFLDGIVPFELKESQVQDIDTLEDWAMAEIKYERIHLGEMN